MVAALTIRPVAAEDATTIAAIYAVHVANGIATFDTKAPSVSETGAKISRITASGWPFIVAEIKGVVVGYAYATQFRDRAAYAATCENSIYIAEANRGQGIGKALIVALINDSEKAGFRQMIAVISDPASVDFHAKFGFRAVGQMHAVGRKFGRWLDTYYLQRELGEGDRTPPERE
ncbi:GNAT family N-acetyltransferase [soil metagenome]